MEPTPAADAPDLIVELLLGDLQMDSCLRLYGHPGLLRVAEAVNGPDFVPFNEVVFIRTRAFSPLEGEREQPRAVAPHRRALPRSPGLYLGSRMLGGGQQSSYWYLLSPNGRVQPGHRLPRAPDGDISRLDYEAARREAPADGARSRSRGSG
jgi:hypothetical protein